MSDKSNEQISNLMDGELEVNASQFLLKRMASDESLSKTWDSYHLIKSCLQKESNEPMIDIASRVAQQINNEDIDLPQQTTEVNTPQMNRWLKPIMGLGIAASVAFMSVTMLQNQQVQGSNSPIVENNIAHTEISNSILQTNINATIAGGETALVPPPSLSRFPSVSAQNNNNFNQAYSYGNDTPYIIIINKSMAKNHKKHLSPIRIQDVSD